MAALLFHFKNPQGKNLSYQHFAALMKMNYYQNLLINSEKSLKLRSKFWTHLHCKMTFIWTSWIGLHKISSQ